MIEELMGALGYVPRALYESEKELRVAAQDRSYEFFDKYNALLIEREHVG